MQVLQTLCIGVNEGCKIRVSTSLQKPYNRPIPATCLLFLLLIQAEKRLIVAAVDVTLKCAFIIRQTTQRSFSHYWLDMQPVHLWLTRCFLLFLNMRCCVSSLSHEPFNYEYNQSIYSKINFQCFFFPLKIDK